MPIKGRSGKPGQEPEELIKLRDTFIAQLPIVAAILATSVDGVYDPNQIAEEAIDICVALEEELSE